MKADELVNTEFNVLHVLFCRNCFGSEAHMGPLDLELLKSG